MKIKERRAFDVVLVWYIYIRLFEIYHDRSHLVYTKTEKVVSLFQIGVYIKTIWKPNVYVKNQIADINKTCACVDLSTTAENTKPMESNVAKKTYFYSMFGN